MISRLVWTTLLLAGCSFPNGEAWQPAIPDGRYSVSEVTCVSTEAAPAFREPEQQLSLYAFTSLTRHQLIIDGRSAWRIIEDEDCRLVQRTQVEANDKNLFGLVKAYSSTFEPEDCSFQLAFGGATIDVAMNNTDFFAESDTLEADLFYAVTELETQYQLTTANSEELGELWESYGCSQQDQITLTLTPVIE